MIGAYRMALESTVYLCTRLILHSDAGEQYCCQQYITLSNIHKVQISMTEHGNPYENTLAEWINRTIKEEFGLGVIVPYRQTAEYLIVVSVHLYNSHRKSASPESSSFTTESTTSPIKTINYLSPYFRTIQ